MIFKRGLHLAPLTLLGLGLLPACPPTGENPTTGDETETSSTGGSTTTTTTTTTTTDPTSSTTDAPTTGTDTTVGPTSSSSSTTDVSSSTTDMTTGSSSGSTTMMVPLTLCEKLGGEPGIGELINTAFGVILTDDKVNGYFLNNDVDASNLGACLVKQIGELATCEGVVYDCLDMKSAHMGLGISANDFMDFAVDFSAALDTHQMAHPELLDQDKMDILTALAGMAPDIVEDMNNDLTVYQRVGRKPAIRTLVGKPGEVDSFVDNVANDAAINGFFGMTDFDRLNTCLTRQVGGIDGPTKYGLEVDAPPPADPGVGVGNECRDMATAHMGLKDANDMIGIDINDFGALVMDLVTAMNTFMVAQADQDAILGVLGPMCTDILDAPFKNDCPGNKKDETVEKLMVNTPIPDDGYDGSVGSMACIDLDFADDGVNVVAGVTATVGLDHTWAGDVTIKIQSPKGTVLTVLSRPGLNETIDGQNQCCGDSADFNNMFPVLFKNMGVNQAEDMGKAIVSGTGIICKDENPKLAACEWNPVPGKGPGMNFNDFKGESAVGTWKVCAGDGSASDTGTLQSAKLTISKQKFP